MILVIAEQDTKLRYAISILAHDQPGWTISGIVGSFDELLTVLENSNPEMLIVDLDMPGMNEIQLEKHLPNSVKQVVLLASNLTGCTFKTEAHREKWNWVSKSEYPELLVKLFADCNYYSS